MFLPGRSWTILYALRYVFTWPTYKFGLFSYVSYTLEYFYGKTPAH